jgi:nicotinate-nucleotide adenylyltransferase
MRPRVGLFGGTFDPPHLGHTILAAEALEQLGLTRLLWVLTGAPPHKEGQPITNPDERIEMVRRALEAFPEFELSRLEIDRPPPHYAVDTVRLAAEQHPGAEVIYILGGDSLHDLPRWHEPRAFVAACHQIGVMRRPGDSVDLRKLESALPGISGKLGFIDAPLLEISSREIRQRARDGRPFRHYLAPAVYEYIAANHLYTSSTLREGPDRLDPTAPRSGTSQGGAP